MQIDFEELEDLIRQNHLEECLIKLDTYSKRANWHFINSNILKEQSRLKELDKNFTADIIPFENFSNAKEKIRNSILNILNEIRAKSIFASKEQRSITSRQEIQNEGNLLEGVWVCEHSSNDSNKSYLWSLLPDCFSLLNIFDKTEGDITCQVSKWNYEVEYNIIVQTTGRGKIKSEVKWISSESFKLTSLNTPKTVMFYTKVI